MNKKTTTLLIGALSSVAAFWACDLLAQAPPSVVPPATPPNLPTRIPPPPGFAFPKDNAGKFQYLSAEYYSQDAKPFLYKRLVKVDTTTGEAWVLRSTRGPAGEVREWLPLTQE